jgi:hypothetical protein
VSCEGAGLPGEELLECLVCSLDVKWPAMDDLIWPVTIDPIYVTKTKRNKSIKNNTIVIKLPFQVSGSKY